MNMRILFSVLLLAIASFAQGPGMPTTCYDAFPYVFHDTIDYVRGMQLKVAETDSSNLENEPSIEHTVDISGIVDSVIDTALIEMSRNGTERIAEASFYYETGSSTIFECAKRLVLKNFKVSTKDESPMNKVLDSAWIFAPLDLDVSVSDSIFIKGYSAIYHYVWQVNTCSYFTRKQFAGEFSVFPSEVEGTTSIKKNAPASERARKGHNRDAAGKALNACNARKAKF